MKKETKEKYVDRPFNIRPLCFWAFFTALTIVICIGLPVVWVGVYFFVLIAGFVSLQFVKSRDKVLQFFGTSRLNFIVTIALCLVVALSFAITTLSYTHQRSFAGLHELEGVVERHNLNDDGSGWFILRDAKFGGSSVSGNVRVFVSSPNESTQEFVVSTYRVKMTVALARANPNDWNVNNNLKYTASLSAREDVTPAGRDNSARSTVLRHSQSFLRKHMSDRNADLMFAMMFGDRSDLDGAVSESFSLAGLGHVLSVSGMHVGIIVGFLMIVLKLCRVPRKHQIPIIVAVLLAYCYLCGFRVSLLRASIMFMVFVVQRAFLRSNDLLSSISLAAIIILVLFPYSLMSVSFQLSFGCMIGIAMFRLPFSNFFIKKVRAPKWLAESLAMYFATFLGCFPFMLKYFGFVSIVGIIMNTLFLPILLIAFQVCFISLFTWITFPLLYIVNFALDFIINITHWASRLPFASVSLSASGYWFLLYFVGLIFTTRFIFLRRRWKYPIAGILILIYTVSIIVG